MYFLALANLSLLRSFYAKISLYTPLTITSFSTLALAARDLYLVEYLPRMNEYEKEWFLVAAITQQNATLNCGWHALDICAESVWQVFGSKY